MWSLSEDGRKHVISFVNNMMSLVVLFSVFVFVLARIDFKGWESYFILGSLTLVVVLATACNICEFMGAPSKSDAKLRRVKELSRVIHKGGFGFKSSMVVMKFCLGKRKLMMFESLALLFLLVGVLLAVLVGATMALPK
jgi:hypothetical protein